ncbi:hypothetical protein RN01_28105 [Cupriavidus sp. SHE]|uniref:hypothetical protein n=1 Tax=Cupriavidus TaxID=106589 RepID=UPI00046B7430|nr:MULTISPECIES: hypothetical protein [Cupriavidus]KWR76466.1 hypothetical protein RN01_28105 [Cupriavidus sp. SHE]
MKHRIASAAIVALTFCSANMSWAQATGGLMDVSAGFVQTPGGTRNVVILTTTPAGLNYCKGWPAGLILSKEKIGGRPGLQNAIGCWNRETNSNITFRYFSLASGKQVEFSIPSGQLQPMKMNDNTELF